MEPEGSLPCSQEPITSPYQQPNPISLTSLIMTWKIPFVSPKIHNVIIITPSKPWQMVPCHVDIFWET
jgi:hypothetical protein